MQSIYSEIDSPHCANHKDRETNRILFWFCGSPHTHTCTVYWTICAFRFVGLKAIDFPSKSEPIFGSLSIQTNFWLAKKNLELPNYSWITSNSTVDTYITRTVQSYHFTNMANFRRRKNSFIGHLAATN